MLEIFNKLKPFFEDNYRRINVREYARLVGISPPSASTLLERFHKENLLNKEKEKIYIYYSANRDSTLMKDLSRAYWAFVINELANHLEKELMINAIVLFGSLVKLETTPKSDIDLAIITKNKKKLDLKYFEKKLNRPIEAFYFESLDKIPNELRVNILNGTILRGYLK